MKSFKNAFARGATALLVAVQLGSAQAQEAAENTENQNAATEEPLVNPEIVEGVERNGIIQYNLPTLRISRSGGLEVLTRGGSTKIGVLDGVVGDVSARTIFDRNVMCLAPGATEPAACPPVPCSGFRDKPASSAGPSCEW